MRKFKKVTFTILTIIVLLFICNILYLFSLYSSIKEQQLQTVYQCMRQSDLIELIRRNHRHGTISPDVPMDFDLPYDMNTSDLNVFQSLAQSLVINSHKKYDTYGIAVDYEFFDSIFRAELEREHIFPEKCKVLPADSAATAEYSGMWHIDYSIEDGSPVIYRAYISPLIGNILSRMAGITVTTGLIIVALTFAFIYLIRTVMKMRTIEEMKDDFTNNMTHELKTPITIAYSANDALLNYDCNNDREKQRRYLKVSLEQLSRLSGLVENILSMSMERRKSLTLAQEKVELESFIEEIVANRLLNNEKPTDIKIEIYPHELTITADSTHLANILNNLLDNAIKYSPGKAEIIIRANDRELSVTDRGMGIPAKSLPLIFNKFYRVPHGNRHDIRGYGIGLFYVKSILDKMGWSISVESHEGQGSTFTIKFNTDDK